MTKENANTPAVIGHRHGVPSSATAHIPVLLREVLDALEPAPGGFYVDGTLGDGGYASAIIRRAEGRLTFLGVDRDHRALTSASERLSAAAGEHAQLTFETANFADIPELMERHSLPPADGLVLDLGFSSTQLESSGRGFSFRADEPLLMTYGDDATPVRDLLQQMDEQEIENVLREFGQERYARRIAEAIVARRRQRPVETSGDLAAIVRAAVPAGYERGRIDPATRTFQALRIHANGELESLDALLALLDRIIAPGGRAAIVSFHSLEDGRVKRAFAALARTGKATLLTKKPITASAAEIAANPRARSARMRALVMNHEI